MLIRSQIATLAFALFVLLEPSASHAILLSYATSATDISGITGSSAVSLGAPDYQFNNDSGLGFGGTSTDVFDVGEVAEFSFPAPLRNIPDQHDLVLSAFVGGLGAIDNANVQVEASSDGVNYSVVATFNTEEARINPTGPHLFPYTPEIDFEGVKHFFIDFDTEDHVSHIRLTNLGGTAEGLRLDAIEGLHPEANSDYAFEIRFDRYREDLPGAEKYHFFVRIKNIADVGGVPIREFRMTPSPMPGATLEDTRETLFVVLSKAGNGVVGESFICIENCIPNCPNIECPPGSIPFSRHAWSVDGLVEAPPGVGLDPGRQVASQRSTPFDVDNTDYLTGMSFRITFADGLVHDFNYDNDVMKVVGSLYQKHLYFEAPDESGPRPTDYYQGLDAAPEPIQVPTLATSAYWVLSLLIAAVGIVSIRVRSRSLRTNVTNGN